MNLRKENDGKTGIITEGASQLVFFFFWSPFSSALCIMLSGLFQFRGNL
jgi:hypothetical protein